MSVPVLLADARAYTAGLTATSSAALDTAVRAVESMGYTSLSYTGSTLPAPPPSSITLTLPVLDTVTLDLPPDPTTTLVFQDIGTLDAGVLPTLSAVAPVLTLPTQPSALDQFTNVAPTINTSVAFPEPPSALLNPLFDAPVLPERSEPVKPNTNLPGFSALPPVDNTVAPTNLDQTFANAYHDAAPNTIAMMEGYVDAMLTKRNPQFAAQMSAIETQLSKYLAGGTALNSVVEDAIYARAREKNEVEAKRVREAAYTEAASRGFTLPSGALLSAVARARQDAANNNAKTSTDIAVAQAEMEQKNLQFAVTTSTGLRTAMVSATISYAQNLSTLNGQALDYAKSIMTALLEMYNTAVKMYSVKLDGYKAEVSVYEVRLKSAMAGIELYQVEVAALNAMVAVDQAKVGVYRARIETLTSLSNVYRAQIEAVQGRVGLEKLKLDVFEAQVRTYGAQVNSKNAEWQGYSAAIGGQTAIAGMYATQVQAYNTQVTGYKAGVEAKVEVVRAAALTNQARATQYSATMSGFQTIVQARGTVATTKLENQRQSIVAFQAKSQAEVSKAQIANEYYKSVSMVGIENSKLAIQAAVSGAEMKRAYSSSLAQLHTANAQIFGNLAGAGLSGMNTLASETLAS